MAVDRINKAGGINGRPVEIIVADDESKPDVGRRKVEKLLVEDKVDAHSGGFLSNICLACMPVFEEHKMLNMISVCLDTTLTTTKCNRYSFRPYDYAPSQAVAFAPYLVKKWARSGTCLRRLLLGPVDPRRLCQEIKKAGGEIVDTTGIPLGTADMTSFLSKISGNFDGMFGIFFGKDGVTIGNQAFDLGLTKKYKWAGDGAIAEFDQHPGARQQDRGLHRHQPLRPGVRCAAQHAVPQEVLRRCHGAAAKIDSVQSAPDRYVQSNYEAMNALQIGMEKSKFRGREDTDKLIAALEGLEMKESDDFPQGDKTLRKEDHQAFLRAVHHQDRRRQAEDHRGGGQGQDGIPAGLQVHLSGG